MSLIAKNSGGVDFEPLAAGTHHAVCYGIIDLGTQPTNNPQFKPARKVAFLFEVPGERIELTQDGVKKDLPRGISGIWTLSLHPKGRMRPMLESWRGRPFTKEEADGFDLKNVLGANCLLSVVHNPKDDKVYANIASVSPLMKNMGKLKAENPLRFFSLDEHKDEIVIPTEIPEWLQTKIKQSREWLNYTNPGYQEPTDAEQANLVNSENVEDCPF